MSQTDRQTDRQKAQLPNKYINKLILYGDKRKNSKFNIRISSTTCVTDDNNG